MEIAAELLDRVFKFLVLCFQRLHFPDVFPLHGFNLLLVFIEFVQDFLEKRVVVIGRILLVVGSSFRQVLKLKSDLVKLRGKLIIHITLNLLSCPVGHFFLDWDFSIHFFSELGQLLLDINLQVESQTVYLVVPRQIFSVATHRLQHIVFDKLPNVTESVVEL